MPVTGAIYEFGEFRLDVARRRLEIGGRTLSLTAKAFDTLLYLVEHRGELLDKTRLMNALWPGVVVEENNLNQNISLLRRVLGERPGEHRFIVTVPGHGYRFVAEVRSVGVALPDVAAGPRPVTRSRTAIAVLPFVNLTGDPAADCLGDALAEELINTLSRVRWFSVSSRTSTFAYRGRNRDVRRIARELDVDAVLEGSIGNAGEQVRVTAKLVDGESGCHVWSESYERSTGSPPRIRDELVVAIVDALAGHVVLGSAGREVPTRDLEAYHLYLRAVSLRGRPTEHNLRRVIELLGCATRRDPEFARAWYAMGEARAFQVANESNGGRLADAAEQDVRRALSLDPSLTGAYSVLGVLSACRGRWLEAEDSFRKAHEIVTHHPEALVHHAVHVARQVGHGERALQEAGAAYELAPASAALAFHVGVQCLLNGADAVAHEWIEAAVMRGYPETLRAVREARAHLAIREGRFTDAVRELAETLSPAERAAGGYEAIRSFCAAVEEPARAAAARGALERWLGALGMQSLNSATARRSILWLTMLGAVDAAHDLAADTVDRPAGSEIAGTGWGILWMGEMQPFRTNPRFGTLCSRLGFDAYWKQYGSPDGYDPSVRAVPGLS